MQISEVKYSDHMIEIVSMTMRHWDEVGMAKMDLELNLWHEYYLYLEMQGKLIAVAAKNEDGKVIGYITGSISRHPHHKENFACIDSLYMDKSVRGLKSYRVVCKMIKLAESIARKKDVAFIQIAASINRPLSRLMEDTGYHPTDIMYCKRI